MVGGVNKCPYKWQSACMLCTEDSYSTITFHYNEDCLVLGMEGPYITLCHAHIWEASYFFLLTIKLTDLKHVISFQVIRQFLNFMYICIYTSVYLHNLVGLTKNTMTPGKTCYDTLSLEFNWTFFPVVIRHHNTTKQCHSLLDFPAT